VTYGLMENNWCNQDLSRLRDAVKKLDFKILELIQERLNFCQKIGEIKRANRLPICDLIQEEKVMATRIEKGKALGLDEEFVRQLLILLMTHSKRIQRNGALV